MLLLLVGFIVGVVTVLLCEILYLFYPRGPISEETFSDQFLPFRIPLELKRILVSPNSEERLRKKESCISVNLLLQFLYQEFSDSKTFRRWLLKKLQMEFNELMSRSATGKLLKDIKIRSLTTGCQFPVIKHIRAENVKLSEDENSFEVLDLILDVEYRGGFELSVDVIALLDQQASLAVSLTKLSGEARLQLNRHPYSHWSFSFVQEPTIDLKVDSKFHGRPLPQLVPLIINQFRRTIRKRHVLPAYKLRFRPFFHNSYLLPSSNPNNYTHIQMSGCLKLGLLNCSRLNLSVIPAGHTELYCVVMTVTKPNIFGQHSTNFVSMAIKFVRYSAMEHVGLTLGREFISEKGYKQISVITVEKGSVADQSGFKVGDLILAVNNICILTERQAAKLLSNTVGEMIVIIERELSKIDNEDEVMDQLSNFDLNGHQQNGFIDKNLKTELNADGYIHVIYDSPSDESASTGGKSLQKARSYVDLTTNSNEGKSKKHSGSPTPTVNVEKVDDEDGRSKTSCEEQDPKVPLRKVHSASILSVQMDSSVEPVMARNSITQEEADRKSIDSSVGLEFSGGGNNSVAADTQSIISYSPHLSRKQKLAERAAQVAQKFNTGKATVKEIIGKRIKRSDDSTSNATQIQKRKTELPIGSGSQLLIPASKSEEAQLGLRVVNLSHSASHASVSRTRSKSEPDTAVLAVDGVAVRPESSRQRDSSCSETESGKRDDVAVGGKDEDKVSTSTGSSEKSPVADSKLQVKKSVKSFEKSTKSMDLKTDPQWKETVTVPLDSRLKYLNVLLYTKVNSTSSSKKVASETPFLLGYVSILLPEVLDDCGTTKSLYHQQKFSLRSPGYPKVPPEFQHLARHPGFDSRLCYGDITLGFHWLPDTNTEDFDVIDGPLLMKDEKLLSQEMTSADPSQPLLVDGHKWISTHFQQATTCDICQKKIWLKTAYKCSDCSMISHKKCLPRAGQLGKCGQVPESAVKDQASKDTWNTEEIVEAVEAVAATLDNNAPEQSSPTAMGSVGRRSHLHNLISEKFAGLRRRKGKGDGNAKSDSDGDGSVERVIMPTLQDLTAGQLSANDSPFHSMLYTKGGTYNEHMIYAAKDLGKDLFVDLAVDERKAKINEQIDKLQVEIDNAIQQRLEVLTKDKSVAQNSPLKQQLQVDINKFDDRLQALAILMLHYCAGLQHCLDIEEANAAAVASSQDDLVSKNENFELVDGSLNGETLNDAISNVDNELVDASLNDETLSDAISNVDKETCDSDLMNLCNNNM